MSDSAPRRQPTQFGVPVNFDTGEPLTTHQQLRLSVLKETGEALYNAMHNAEGSAPPGEHQDHIYTSRRMQRAADLLESALMLARKAALEAE